LTRDDAGGLRFLLSPNNIVFETTLPTVTVGGRASAVGSSTAQTGVSPWIPFLNVTNLATNVVTTPTNTTTTNINLNIALRGGVDKITFQRVNFDSVLGTTFTPITHRYQERIINANGQLVSRSATRTISRPDIIFAVDDLGVTPGGGPFPFARTVVSGWTNNAALNTSVAGALGGPGIIVPPIEIIFSDLIPSFVNTQNFPNDGDGASGFLWGSFDGTDRPPVVFPVFVHPLFPELSLEYLQNTVRGRN